MSKQSTRKFVTKILRNFLETLWSLMREDRPGINCVMIDLHIFTLPVLLFGWKKTYPGKHFIFYVIKVIRFFLVTWILFRLPNYCKILNKVKSTMLGAPRGKSTTAFCEVSYQLLAVMLLKWPYVQLILSIDHRQLRTMASETVDPIDYSLPHSLEGSIPWAPLLRFKCEPQIWASRPRIER